MPRRHTRIPVLAGLFLLAAAWLSASAATGLQVGGFQVAGRTITVQVHNPTPRTLSGAILVEVSQAGEAHTAAADVTVGAGSTVGIPIILGTITEDINPLGSIKLGTITDDINPF